MDKVMFFSKKKLMGSIYYFDTRIFYISHKQTKKGLEFMNDVLFECSIGDSNETIGKNIISILNAFEDNANVPDDLTKHVKMIIQNRMGLKSWNALFKKAEHIVIEAIKDKKVSLIPSNKKNNYYALDYNHIIHCKWNPEEIGHEIKAIINGVGA